MPARAPEYEKAREIASIPFLSLPFSLTSSPTNKINASLAALRSHSGIVCATYVDLRFLIARNGSHVPDDAEQSSKDERSHSRNQVTKKKKNTTTPQNEFSSWRCSLVKNQRAVPRSHNLRPATSQTSGNPGEGP